LPPKQEKPNYPQVSNHEHNKRKDENEICIDYNKELDLGA
jgi:hypothetical protein